MGLLRFFLSIFQVDLSLANVNDFDPVIGSDVEDVFYYRDSRIANGTVDGIDFKVNLTRTFELELLPGR